MIYDHFAEVCTQNLQEHLPYAKLLARNSNKINESGNYEQGYATYVMWGIMHWFGWQLLKIIV